MTSVLHEGETCWRIAKADRLSIIIDAADFFRHAKSAMVQARRSIYMIGWDFDTRIDLIPGNGDDKNRPDELPDRLGDFLNALAERNEDLDIRILKWDIGLINSITRGETPFYILKWMFDKRIHLKLDGAHPTISSHHMKLLVIDEELAFCGGIDMTVGRWDTRDHAEKEPLRKSPMGFAQGPWHDATTCLSGEAARALADVARNRWRLAAGEELPSPEIEPGVETPWPEELEVGFRDISIGIARTAPEYGERQQIVEIETAKLAIIAAVRKTLYVESQYFASRRIAEAMAARLQEADGPEIVLINPDGCEGFLEAKAMDSARVRLMKLVKDADIHNRFRIYYPVNAARTPIYVHAKMMFADDRIVKIGSANLNNRSMGYDTECDLILEAQNGQDVLSQKITATRDDLIAEHLGCEPEMVTQTIASHGGSIIAAIEALNRSTGRGLVPVPMRELTPDEEMFAESDIADPERPAGVRYRTSSFLKRRLGRRGRRVARAAARAKPA